MKHRVVITAVGVVSSLGDHIDGILDRLKTETFNIERTDFDDTVAVCPVPNFNIRNYTGRNKNIRYLNRGAQFAVASAVLALKATNLRRSSAADAGLFTGAGPNFDIGEEIKNIRDRVITEQTLAALWMLRFLPNTAGSTIAQIAGIHGENLTVCTACAASLQAIGEAFRKVQDGYLPLALAGGGDSRLNPGGILAYKKSGALRTRSHSPTQSENYHVFDKRHKGFIPGEGGAFLLLESLDHAENRKAAILGEICGYSASMDGYNMTAPHPEGLWEEKAVRAALTDARIDPEDIDLISAHGTGTPLNDTMEADMIARVFGKSTPVIALKSRIGHLASACGAVELAICIGLMKTGWVPGIPALTEPCRKEVRFVKKDLSLPIDAILLENFGFGGQNAALVVKKWKD